MSNQKPTLGQHRDVSALGGLPMQHWVVRRRLPQFLFWDKGRGENIEGGRRVQATPKVGELNISWGVRRVARDPERSDPGRTEMCMPQHLVPRFGVWAGAVGLRSAAHLGGAEWDNNIEEADPTVQPRGGRCRPTGLGPACTGWC